MTKTLHRLELNSRRTLVVEDMTVDIGTGKAAGTATAAAFYEYEGREELKKLEPDCRLEKITDLIGMEGI